MYGLVLMMALNGGAETPEFGHKKSGCSGYVSAGCSGGYGCSSYGGGYGCSSYGGGYASCSGSYGCSSSRGHGLFSKLRGHGKSGCSGSYGCSASYYGCSGGGYGCSGGGYGCSSSYYGGGYGCTGGAAHGGYGCTGGVIYHGGHGCTGGYGCTGGVIIDAGHGAGSVAPPPAEKLKDMPKTKPMGEGMGRNRSATIVVELPADAKLLIDDAATRATSTVRTFVTPELDASKTFSYTLKAEIVRDGQTLTASEKVTVNAGVETRVSLDALKFGATVAAK